jgi:hypothetical protein
MMKIRFFKLWGTHVIGVRVLVTVTVGMARNELHYGVASDGDALKHLAKLFKFLTFYAAAAAA